MLPVCEYTARSMNTSSVLQASTHSGGMVPTTCPVAASASAGVASLTRQPIWRSSAALSMRKVPGARTSSGIPFPATNTIDFTICEASASPSDAADSRTVSVGAEAGVLTSVASTCCSLMKSASGVDEMVMLSASRCRGSGEAWCRGSGETRCCGSKE
eukprot:scaffold102236_cov67-Phaeocystis_antarctica.AAC.8